MTQYVFRLSTPADKPAIQRLQEQCTIEMNTPLTLLGGDSECSEFLLVEALQAGSRQAVGMISITRASNAPFLFEMVFPDVWQRTNVATLTGNPRLRREDLVELDTGYLEKPHRTRQLSLLTLSGGLLHAQRRRYPVAVGIASPMTLAQLPNGIFHGTGLVRMVGGIPFELGTFPPTQSVPLMAEVVQESCAGNRLVPWHLEVR